MARRIPCAVLVALVLAALASAAMAQCVECQTCSTRECYKSCVPSCSGSSSTGGGGGRGGGGSLDNGGSFGNGGNFGNGGGDRGSQQQQPYQQQQPQQQQRDESPESCAKRGSAFAPTAGETACRVAAALCGGGQQAGGGKRSSTTSMVQSGRCSEAAISACQGASGDPNNIPCNRMLRDGHKNCGGQEFAKNFRSEVTSLCREWAALPEQPKVVVSSVVVFGRH